MKKLVLAWLVLAASLGLAACTTTSQTGKAKPAGFLKNYSQLKPGEGEQAQLVFVRPGTAFADYHSIIVDPVTIWRSEGRSIEKVPDEDLKELADRFERMLRSELSSDWGLVDRPAPGVMRLRVALTEAKGAPVVMNVVSSVLPQARIFSGAKKLATGTHAFVGSASVEAELLDAITNERLLAAVDERAGTKALRGGVGTWSDADQAFAYWAKRLRVRLAELRAGG